MLVEIKNKNQFKEDFEDKFLHTLSENEDFNDFLDKLFLFGNTYVFGEYLRNIILNKQNNEIDLIVVCKKNNLVEIIKSLNLNYNLNNFNIIITFKNIKINLWSIKDTLINNNNSTYKKNDYFLDKIANNCFYNYDSLVLNLKTKKINIKHYNNFIKSKCLDIIQKNNKPRLINQSIEENILCAFYIKENFDIKLTNYCQNYLLARLGFLNDKYGSNIIRLLQYNISNKKYHNSLNKDNIIQNIYDCYNNPLENTLNF